MAATRWMVGLALLGLLAAQVDLAGVVDHVGRGDLALASMGIGGLVALHVLGAVTWSALLSRLAGVRLRPKDAIRTYYIAQGLGALTPANIGADAYRVYATRGRIAWQQAMRPVIVQRVTSALALAAVALLSLLLLPEPAEVAAIVIPVVIVLLVASSWIALDLHRRSLVGQAGGGGGRDPAAGTWRKGRGTLLAAFAAGGLFHIGSLGFSLLLVAAVTPVQDPGPVFGSLAIARLALLVPITPSGLGVQEGALTFLFLRVGLSPEIALAAALLSRLAMLATATIGLVLSVASPAKPQSRLEHVLMSSGVTPMAVVNNVHPDHG